MKFSLLPFGFALIALSQLCGCASHDSSNNTSSSTISSGGGTNPIFASSVIMINGIDIWQNGVPNQSYKVLSTIDTERISDVSPNNTLLQSLAKKAKKAGGNGVIILLNDIQTTGGQDLDPSYNPSAPPAVVDNTITTTKAQIILYTAPSPAIVKTPSQP